MSKQSATYTIEHSNIGNLLYRKDNLTNQYENFAYDNLDRLTGISYNGGASQTISYAANGNISNKFDGGAYTYGTKPHAVATVTKTAGTVQQNMQEITYTPFNKAASIKQTKTSTGKILWYDITYGPDEQRVKTVYTDTLNAVTTRYYAGSYEKEIKGSATRQIHYISGGTGLVAVYIKKNTDSGNLYYVCTDRQGSITALLNINGTVAERYSYDAWGRRRNPANWNDYNVPAPSLINRGYTGHEMLDAFGLINMNGRMYDPVIGRILSPDKYVQSPTNTQSYNRYSYCFNNPLKYTDPSGWIAPESDGPEVVWNVPGLWQGTKGGVGPGSGNHWSDGVRDEWGNFMVMSAGTFTGIYGQNEYDKIYNAVTGNVYTITDRDAIKAFMQALKVQAEVQKHADEITSGYPGGGMSYDGIVGRVPSGGGVDWQKTQDVTKIIYIINSIRSANQRGQVVIDLRQLFSNFPKYGDGVEMIGNIKIGSAAMIVHMTVGIHDDMRIGINCSRMKQVGPFNDVNVNGIYKQGYWEMMGFDRAGGNIPILGIQTNTNFGVLYDYMYK